MKIAALYDIHGNLPALNAVLKELKEVQPDLIIVGGDIVSGPMPGQTLEGFSQCGSQIHTICGNGIAKWSWLLTARRSTGDTYLICQKKVREENHWVAEQLTRSQRDFLATLPEQLVLQVDGLNKVLFCHATRATTRRSLPPLRPKSDSARSSPR